MQRFLLLVTWAIFCGLASFAAHKPDAEVNKFLIFEIHKVRKDSVNIEVKDTLPKIAEPKFPNPFTPFLILGQPYQPK
jgi:hypothetical protein